MFNRITDVQVSRFESRDETSDTTEENSSNAAV